MMVSPITFGQTYTQYVSFADEKMEEGDYYYAIVYYDKAMEVDSNSVEILWKYAEANRLYKDYVKAEYYYQKVYDKEQAKIYPYSIFWLATMQQYNGKYKEAANSWKLSKKAFKRQRREYPYKKSLQGFRANLWAKKAVIDTTDYIVEKLPDNINSYDTELSPYVYDNTLYLSSLKADSINGNEEVFTTDYSIQVFQSEIQNDSTYGMVEKVDDIYLSGFNAANVSVSPDGKRIYFSRCNSDYQCKIFVGRIEEGKITDIDSLGEVINEPNANTTMPNVTQIEGQEVLFFCSNREGTNGGLDIWYSTIKNGNQYSKARNLGRRINSIEDDITPFYDTLDNRLYFSSSWHPGFGGYDVFYLQKMDEVIGFEAPVNMGLTINSSQNDTYFIRDFKRNRYYFSSNRVGTNSLKTPTCCNDIFVAYLPQIKEPESPFASLDDLNKRLPVTLYFHNDEPNPRTRDTTTDLTYMQSYEAYIELIPTYKKEYSKGLSGDEAEEAREDIEDFFVEYVQQGVSDLYEFIRLLLIELDKGYQIEVTVKGFASPLAKTDYNVNLTKRRINSLINYLYAYGHGEFVPYLDHTATNGGTLSFVQIPFGEYTANTLISDNVNDTKNSVYSRKAALERKIEIQSVSLVTQDSSYAEMKFDREVYDFGATQSGQILTYTFHFTNTGTELLQISDIIPSSDAINATCTKMELQAGESAEISITLDTSMLKGLVHQSVVIHSNIKGKTKEISVTTEVSQ